MKLHQQQQMWEEVPRACPPSFCEYSQLGHPEAAPSGCVGLLELLLISTAPVSLRCLSPHSPQLSNLWFPHSREHNYLSQEDYRKIWGGKKTLYTGSLGTCHRKKSYQAVVPQHPGHRLYSPQVLRESLRLRPVGSVPRREGGCWEPSFQASVLLGSNPIGAYGSYELSSALLGPSEPGYLKHRL